MRKLAGFCRSLKIAANVACSVLALGMILCALSDVATAADLTLLSGGAAKSGLGEIIPSFEATSGHKIKTEYAPMARLMAALADGATPDVVIVTGDVLPEALAKGYVRPETVVFGRVDIGVAVKTGAALPDISTPDALKATLLAAPSIIIINPATGTSGKYLATLFQKLGIAEALAPKLEVQDIGYVAERVATGEVALALHQMTELRPVAGITIVGPLPPSLQKTTVYVAAVHARAKDPAAAAAFIQTLRTPVSRAALAAKGYAD